MRQSIISLHGLFGGLSNWKAVIDYFELTYDVHVPLLSIMDEHKKDECGVFNPCTYQKML